MSQPRREPPSAGRSRPPSGPFASFLRGAADPWRGLGFLFSHPHLWAWAALPFFLSLLFYIALIALGWHFVAGWLQDASFQERGWGWRALGYLLIVLFWLAALAVSAVAFIPLAALVAAPFNDLLSEKTERLYRGLSAQEPFSLRALARSLRVGLTGEIKRLLTVSFFLVLALSLNLIPLIGPLAAAVASALVTIRYLSLEFTSFSMDRRFYSWKAKRDFLRRFAGRTFGFGAMSFAIMMVPLLNALFIPVSAVAGTLLFCDTELAGEGDHASHVDRESRSP